MSMRNAKEELVEHIEDRNVEFIRIAFRKNYNENPLRFEGSLKDTAQLLDFFYDAGFGGQELFGFILYSDGTWSEREEYDGSEWWTHMERPTINTQLHV